MIVFGAQVGIKNNLCRTYQYSKYFIAHNLRPPACSIWANYSQEQDVFYYYVLPLYLAMQSCIGDESK